MLFLLYSLNLPLIQQNYLNRYESFRDRTNEVIFTPPQGEDVIRKMMGYLVSYLNDGEGSLVKLAILHYQFETIHPFYDGNGRAGRIINILYLIMNRFLEIPILYLSSYIIKNKSKYYELLLSVTKNELGSADSDYDSFLTAVMNSENRESLFRIISKRISESMYS
ncbi:MAG: Fic family protein [Spirochaetales bacterium]|nr:Fic family protein [Spirochaetales bacterium]